MSEIRTAIVGSLSLLREGVQSTLRRSGFKVIVGVSDLRILTADLRLMVESCSLFVVLSDDLSAASTRALISTLRDRVPTCSILLLCDEDAAHEGSGLLAAGAVACLPSSARPDALIEALRALTSGVTFKQPPADKSNDVAVSPREWEVLEALSLGETNKHIARRLGISDATVKAHIRLILKKTGCANRTQAVLWALSRRDAGHSHR